MLLWALFRILSLRLILKIDDNNHDWALFRILTADAKNSITNFSCGHYLELYLYMLYTLDTKNSSNHHCACYCGYFLSVFIQVQLNSFQTTTEWGETCTGQGRRDKSYMVWTSTLDHIAMITKNILSMYVHSGVYRNTCSFIWGLMLWQGLYMNNKLNCS